MKKMKLSFSRSELVIIVLIVFVFILIDTAYSKDTNKVVVIPLFDSEKAQSQAPFDAKKN